MVKAISPAEAGGNKVNVLPKELVEAINLLITEKYRGAGKSFTIKAKDIIAKAESLLPPGDGDYTGGEGRAHIDWYGKGFMDFEPIYEAQGWKVGYTSPDYTESFDSYYEFTAKRKD